MFADVRQRRSLTLSRLHLRWPRWSTPTSRTDFGPSSVRWTCQRLCRLHRKRNQLLTCQVDTCTGWAKKLDHFNSNSCIRWHRKAIHMSKCSMLYLNKIGVLNFITYKYSLHWSNETILWYRKDINLSFTCSTYQSISRQETLTSSSDLKSVDLSLWEL